MSIINTTLKVETSRVLDAAKACPTAKKVLSTLFPEVFVDDRYFDLEKLTSNPFEKCLVSDAKARAAGLFSNAFLQVRGNGKLKGKGFFLSQEYNWKIEKDDEGYLVLIPTRK